MKGIFNKIKKWLKGVCTWANLKQFLFNWLVALGIVIVLEIIASIISFPLGVLVWFSIVGLIYYGQKRMWF